MGHIYKPHISGIQFLETYNSHTPQFPNLYVTYTPHIMGLIHVSHIQGLSQKFVDLLL